MIWGSATVLGLILSESGYLLAVWDDLLLFFNKTGLVLFEPAFE